LGSLIGVYGLTGFAVLLGSSFAALADKRGRLFLILVWAAFAVSTGWGAWRLYSADHVYCTACLPPLTLRLVQGNVAASDAPTPEQRREGLDTYIRLTQAPGLEKVAYVLWPESSVPFLVEAGAPLTRLLGHAVPGGAFLITGGIRMQGQGPDWRIWNSMMVFDHDGAIVGSYDKVKLVPFGEFLPFRWLLPKSWLTPVGETDFSSGDGIKTLDWPRLPPLRPLICYEAIFPELSMPQGQNRPQMLLNITNDAWFGHSSGPYQHFQMARMRAVEQGIPLVRVANTGISAMVDSYGRVRSFLPLGKQGILDVGLQKPQPHGTTYNAYGNKILLSLIFIAALLILRLQKRQ
jgi:apolipoprotein N-acyltransferase